VTERRQPRRSPRSAHGADHGAILCWAQGNLAGTRAERCPLLVEAWAGEPAGSRTWSTGRRYLSGHQGSGANAARPGFGSSWRSSAKAPGHRGWYRPAAG